MIDVVIIGKNEGAYVDKMIQGLPEEWNIFYVADRCEDDTLEKLGKYSNVYPLDTTLHGLEGRQTSYCRNLGLSFTEPTSDVLFLDGDRYIVEGDIKALENSQADITLLTLEEDGRAAEDFCIGNVYGTVFNGFFSCGILFKRDAITKLTTSPYLKREQASNPILQNSMPQLFPEFLQQDWGIEDTALGDICYSIGLSITLNSDIKLRGKFDRNMLDSLDVIEKRLRFRDKLKNVIW